MKTKKVRFTDIQYPHHGNVIRPSAAEAAVKQATASSQYNPQNIRNKVVEVGTTVETGLDEFNETAKGYCTYENGRQAKATCACQGEY